MRPARTSRRTRNPESGFAMLFVFVMAASIALMMYREMPRVAFESQRNREEMLIERGEQYMRGIKLYVRKFKKYPGTMEELENTNQIRFLRRRYDDPMTGKKEWRIVHVGPGGQFTDSLVYNPKGQEKGQQSVNTFTWDAGAAPTGTNQGAPSVALRRRDSEMRGMQPQGEGQPGDPTAPQQTAGRFPPGQPQPGVIGGVYTVQQPQESKMLQYDYPQPGELPQPQRAPVQPQPGQFRGGTVVMPGGFPQGMQQPQQPGQPQQPVNPYQLGAQPQQQVNPYQVGAEPQQAVNPYQPGAQQSFQFPQGQQQPLPGTSPYSTVQGMQGQFQQFPQPGRTPVPGGNQPAVSNQALGLIQQLLTQPRQGGLQGNSAPGSHLTITGGIAGVASLDERQSIKIYNERDKYNEWEFVYDISKDKTQGGGAGVPGQQAGGAPGTPGAPAGAPTGDGPIRSMGNFQGSPATGGTPAQSTNTFTGYGSFVGQAPQQQPAQPQPGQPQQPGFGQPGQPQPGQNPPSPFGRGR